MSDPVESEKGQTDSPGSSPGGGGSNTIATVSDGILGAGLLIILGVGAGNWLDEKAHSAPWFSLALSLLGGGLGLARLVSKANSLDSKKEAKKEVK
jgi:F0F1-type ATP synthase assembly protein I